MKTFVEFIRTGRIASLQCGMAYEKAREVINEAVKSLTEPGRGVVLDELALQDIQRLGSLGAYGPNAAKIVKSGPLELSFFRAGRDREPTLISICYRTRDPYGEPDFLPLSRSALEDKNEPLDHFMNGLGALMGPPPMDIHRKLMNPNAAWSLQECRRWLYEQNIKVVGGQEHGMSPHLTLESGVRIEFDRDGMTCARYSPKIAPDVKQVTLTLSKADLEKVERAAAAAGTTLAKICSEWIRERASTLNQPAETGAR